MEETDPPVEDLGNELQQYEHLQHLYLKQNGLRDISGIAHLNHLLTVNASTNAIGSIKFLEELGGSDRLQFLQVSSRLNIVTALYCVFSVLTSVETSLESFLPSLNQDYPG